MYDPLEIVGYDVVADNGAIIAPLVSREAAEQIVSAQGGRIVPVPRAYSHRAAYIVRETG